MLFVIVHFSTQNQIDSIHSSRWQFVEFVHSLYSCILTSQVSIQFLCPTKLVIILILVRKIKARGAARSQSYTSRVV